MCARHPQILCSAAERPASRNRLTFHATVQKGKHAMKKFLMTTAILAALATSAEAGCSKASLNGLWSMELGGTEFLISINGGVFYFSNDKFTIGSFGSNCRGSGSFLDTSGPTTYPAIFAAEAGAGGTSLKPMRLIAAFVSAGAYQVYVLTRK
jgi:hypothetical protein